MSLSLKNIAVLGLSKYTCRIFYLIHMSHKSILTTLPINQVLGLRCELFEDGALGSLPHYALALALA